MQLQIDGSVDSIYIYISDALRYDAVPAKLQEYGEVVKTAASGTKTCTSFPTIVTGLYPPHHGVWTFSGLIHPSTETIFDFIETDCPCYWTPAPINDSIDNVTHHNNLVEFFSDIEQLDDDFIILDRDNLPHLPYGYDSADGLQQVTEKYGYDMSPAFADRDYTTAEYKKARSGDFERMRSEYNQGARASVRRFESRLGILRELGMLENTLVIFTSDHGEELGEYGQFTHGSSPVPETVYVPTLFYRDDGHITTQGDFMAHIDLFPTIATAVDTSITANRPGYNLFDGAPEHRQVFTGELFSRSNDEEKLHYSSWNKNGGHAFSDEGYRDTLSFLKNQIRSGYSLQHVPLLLYGEFTRRNSVHGDPSTDRNKAKQFCEEQINSRSERVKQELTNDVKERLRDLGYADESIE